MFFCGGYNCRHRRLASSYYEYTLTNGQKENDKKNISNYYSKEDLQNKIKNIFNFNLDDEALSIFNGCVIDIKKDFTTKNSYITNKGEIVIGKDSKNEYSQKHTLYHELGHAFVYKYNLIKLEYEFENEKLNLKKVNYDDLFISKFEEQRLIIWKFLGKIKQKLDEKEIIKKYIAKGLDFITIQEQISAIKDYFGSLTNGYIQGSHSQKYYLNARNSNAKHEWFANMSSIYFLKMEIFKEEFPEFYALVNNSFRDIIYETLRKNKP